MISQEDYNVLKSLADDLAVSREFDKSFERYVKIVVEDEGKDRIVNKFSPEKTRAALLLAMVKAHHAGLDSIEFVKKKTESPRGKAKPKDEVDEFTADALKKIPPGGPDSAILNPPHAKIDKRQLVEINGEEMIVCLECNTATPKGHPKKKFCSDKCRDAARQKKKGGKL